MKNILFYGNCQLEKLKDVLNLSQDNYNVTFVPCFLTSYTDVEFDYILKQSDIIITQPICDNYKDKYYLSSNYLVNKCKKDSVIIFLNNCHFTLYYLDLTYNNNLLLEKDVIVNCYHESMNHCINNNYDFDYYKKNYIENTDFKTLYELKEIYDKDINELKKRYEHMFGFMKHNTFFINVVTLIEENYKENLLFYTFNHPTKYLLQLLAKEIIEILKIPNTINYQLDPFASYKCILYSCVQKIVNFDINKCKPLINNKTELSDIYNSYSKKIDNK